jgi:hypothetical protein
MRSPRYGVCCAEMQAKQKHRRSGVVTHQFGSPPEHACCLQLLPANVPAHARCTACHAAPAAQLMHGEWAWPGAESVRHPRCSRYPGSLHAAAFATTSMHCLRKRLLLLQAAHICRAVHITGGSCNTLVLDCKLAQAQTHHHKSCMPKHCAASAAACSKAPQGKGGLPHSPAHVVSQAGARRLQQECGNQQCKQHALSPLRCPGSTIMGTWAAAAAPPLTLRVLAAHSMMYCATGMAQTPHSRCWGIATHERHKLA